MKNEIAVLVDEIQALARVETQIFRNWEAAKESADDLRQKYCRSADERNTKELQLLNLLRDVGA